MHVPRVLLLALLATLPALGALAAPAPAPDADVAVPLRADTPADYTPEIHRKVLLAAERGMAYDAVEGREVALAAHHLFIRPGATMWSPHVCTMGFVFGSPGSYKISTAGHCARVGEAVVILAYPGVFANVGITSVSRDNGPGDDFALVDIRSSMQAYVDANVACAGGPRGVYGGDGRDVLLLKYVGASMPCVVRHGALTRLDARTFTCACQLAPGDSGAPVLAVTADNPVGYGLGLMTHMLVGTSGTGIGVRLTVIPATLRDGDVNPLPPA